MAKGKDKTKRSGGGGATAAAPTSVADTKDFNEMKEYMKSNYNIEIDDSLGALDHAAVSDALSGVEEMIKRYPELKNSIKDARVEGMATFLMACNGNEILFNEDFFGDKSRIDAIIQRGNNIGHNPKNTSIKTIGVHETAHALVGNMTDRYVDRMTVAELFPSLSTAQLTKLSEVRISQQRKMMKAKLWNDATIAQEIVNGAYKSAKSQGYGNGKKLKELAATISAYAAEHRRKSTTAHEIIAEAFADVLTNGAAAADFSKTVYNTLNSYREDYNLI